ncbi:MAG: winged helix-turn-helix transcriptional regulator [Acidobacteriota bacterium]|nr:winged helix-turn-helix transcriptional regulator [Acidobacteriota bacterium]
MPSIRRKDERIRRVWEAYRELTQAAEWVEAKLAVSLSVFGLRRAEFRLLVALYQHGPLTFRGATEKLGRMRRGLHQTVKDAEEFGWVELGERELPAADLKESRLPKKDRGKPRRGRRVGLIRLSAEGERLIGKVLPRQEAIVGSLMDALEARELDSLARLCRKLRRDDALPYGFEVMRQAREYEAGAEAGESE